MKWNHYSFIIMVFVLRQQLSIFLYWNTRFRLEKTTNKTHAICERVSQIWEVMADSNYTIFELIIEKDINYIILQKDG